MATDAQWQNLVKGMLKAEMKRRNMTYEQLGERLVEIGAQTASTQVLRNKVSRGGFSAVFLVQCLKAMGCRNLSRGRLRPWARRWTVTRSERRRANRARVGGRSSA